MSLPAGDGGNQVPLAQASDVASFSMLRQMSQEWKSERDTVPAGSPMALSDGSVPVHFSEGRESDALGADR